MHVSKRASVIAAAIAIACIAGAAFAAWTTGGSGHATAQARTSIALATVAVPASGASLYPGADAKVTVRVNNDNDYPVRITDVAFGSAAATTTSGALGVCPTGADAGLLYTDQTGLALDVAAHATATFDVDGVHMDTGAPNGCQGATFTIPVTLTGASNVAP